jgi:NADPH:quinone reductase-like Zn-dependent oxidoreductase
MKAIVQAGYGSPSVLQLQECEKPSPKDNEVLVRVHASSVNALDWRLFTFPLWVRRLIGRGFGQPKQRSCGADVAGTVEAVGAGVTQFRPGDAVFGTTRGAFAEYVCSRQERLVLKPATVSFEAAAAVPVAAFTALQALRDQGQVRPGQKVLINGAGGGVGTFAVQIAKAFGADVTAVCSTRNQDLARSLGADEVIDYTREDFTTGGRRYDVIVNVNGYQPMLTCARALSPDGIYVWVGGSLASMAQTLFPGSLLSRFGRRKFRASMANANQKDLLVLKELIETGKVVPRSTGATRSLESPRPSTTCSAATRAERSSSPYSAERTKLPPGPRNNERYSPQGARPVCAGRRVAGVLGRRVRARTDCGVVRPTIRRRLPDDGGPRARV